MNVRTRGILPFLDDEAVIEVRAKVGPDSILPHPVPATPPLVSGIVAHVARYEQLGVEAALHGGRDRVVRALLAHPLVGQYATAQALADRLIAENKERLPWAQ